MPDYSKCNPRENQSMVCPIHNIDVGAWFTCPECRKMTNAEKWNTIHDRIETVRQEEREACAKIIAEWMGNELANLIRARGK